MRDIGLGLLGFGTVGAGVVEGLQRNGELLSARLGARPVLRAVADLDIASDRGVAVDTGLLTRDAAAVVADPAVDVVIELIGGTGAARALIVDALRRGKPVVTANKALLAEHAEEIFGLAAETGTDLYYGASVGGGIPIIRALREGLVANRVDQVLAILNGTCNFILTEMESSGLSFDEALAEATARGYAEAEPSLDVDGHDTAHKAALLASLACGGLVGSRAVPVEGIRRLALADIRNALDLGYRIKLLAVIKTAGDRLDVRVHPTLVPLDHVLASVNGVYNGVVVEGDLAGRTLFYGRGAGRNPTASTVLGDVADVIRNLLSGSVRRIPGLGAGAGPEPVSPADSRSRYYFRLMLADRPGVLATIAAAFGNREISIASALQKGGHEEGYVPVVFVTHEAVGRNVAQALAEIRGLDVVGAEPVAIRIEG